MNDREIEGHLEMHANLVLIVTFALSMDLVELRWVKENRFNSSELHRVVNLRLRDVNSSVLADSYPVYFWLDLDVHGRWPVSVLFARHGESEAGSRSYRDVSVRVDGRELSGDESEGRCVLHLGREGYELMRQSGSKALRSWMGARSRSLHESYIIDLSIAVFGRMLIRVGLDYALGGYVAHVAPYPVRKPLLAGM